MSTIKEYVIFKLAGEHYGIDIGNVENIEKPFAITRVPYAENYVIGVINLRGNIIPVIDLRKRFGIEKKEFDEETRIIIVSVNELNIGMVVDSASEVLQLDRENVDAAPSISNNTTVNFVKEIGKNDGRIVMLIDLKKVLGVEELDLD